MDTKILEIIKWNDKKKEVKLTYNPMTYYWVVISILIICIIIILIVKIPANIKNNEKPVTPEPKKKITKKEVDSDVEVEYED